MATKSETGLSLSERETPSSHPDDVISFGRVASSMLDVADGESGGVDSGVDMYKCPKYKVKLFGIQIKWDTRKRGASFASQQEEELGLGLGGTSSEVSTAGHTDEVDSSHISFGMPKATRCPFG